MTEAAGMVLHGDLADSIAQPVGHGGQKPIQFPVEVRQRVFGHLAPIRLEAAVEIAQAHAGDQRGNPVEQARGERLTQRVAALSLPAGDQVAIAIERGQQPRDFAGIVLQVGV